MSQCSPDRRFVQIIYTREENYAAQRSTFRAQNTPKVLGKAFREGGGEGGRGGDSVGARVAIKAWLKSFPMT